MADSRYCRPGRRDEARSILLTGAAFASEVTERYSEPRVMTKLTMVNLGAKTSWMSLIEGFKALTPEDMLHTSKEDARTEENFKQADRVHEAETRAGE